MYPSCSESKNIFAAYQPKLQSLKQKLGAMRAEELPKQNILLLLLLLFFEGITPD